MEELQHINLTEHIRCDLEDERAPNIARLEADLVHSRAKIRSLSDLAKSLRASENGLEHFLQLGISSLMLSFFSSAWSSSSMDRLV